MHVRGHKDPLILINFEPSHPPPRHIRYFQQVLGIEEPDSELAHVLYLPVYFAFSIAAAFDNLFLAGYSSWHFFASGERDQLYAGGQPLEQISSLRCFQRPHRR